MKETNLSYGQKITKLRQEHGMSLDDLARESKLTKSHLMELEAGKRPITQSELLKLTEVFDCAESAIIEDKDWLAMLGSQIGYRIRALREEKNLSLTELGNFTNLSPTYLSEIEREESIPSLPTLRKLAKFFDVPISIFLNSNSIGSIMAEKLIKARRQKGLSQKELAKLAGVSPGLIGQLEKGKVNASLKTIKKLAEVLDVSVCYLILEREEIDEILAAISPTMREYLLNPDVQLLIGHICQMSKEELRLVFNFISMLKDPRIN
jgi:transcriptional regulator with XRE-family HTH domain